MYSKSTLIVFERIGAFFADVLYNKIYKLAVIKKEHNKHNNITDAYMFCLREYSKSLDKNATIKNMIKDMKFYINNYDPTLIRFSDVLNNIICEFVPSDFFDKLEFKQKLSILKNIITDVNKKIIYKIITERKIYFEMIIDNHYDETNGKIVKDDIISIIKDKREEIYTKFSGEDVAGSNETKYRAINKLKYEMEKIYKEKKVLKKENEDLKKRVQKLVNLLKEMKKKEHKDLNPSNNYESINNQSQKVQHQKVQHQKVQDQKVQHQNNQSEQRSRETRNERAYNGKDLEVNAEYENEDDNMQIEEINISRYEQQDEFNDFNENNEVDEVDKVDKVDEVDKANSEELDFDFSNIEFEI